MRKKLIAAGVVLAGGLAGAGWVAHKPLLVRYHVGRLEASDDAVERGAQLGELALRPEVGQGAAVVPLLRDDRPEVRRGAILAVGELRELVPDEDLLPSLHDADEDVRGLCEAALRGRGLTDKDVRLAKLAGDPS